MHLSLIGSYQVRLLMSSSKIACDLHHSHLNGGKDGST